MADALFNNIDCIMLDVEDLEAALKFYHDELGHKLVWRTENAAGLSFGDGVTEMVIGVHGTAGETDIRVESAVEAAERFVSAGGSILKGPFDTAIGKCVVVKDPWGNILVLLDCSKGLLKTDENRFVIS